MNLSWIRHRFACGMAAAWLGMSAWGAAMDESKLPPPAQRQVDFDRDIRPLLEDRCYRCHGPERPRSGFRLDTREAALKGGDHGVDILPGQSGQSPLIHYVARMVDDMEMPPEGRGHPLSPAEVGLLRAWIDQGALWSQTQVARTTLFSIEPSLAWISVSGNERQFREHTGRKEGWSGGIQEVRLEEHTPDGTRLDADARLLFHPDDYRVRLQLEKQDLGFVRFGFEQYRRYYDDTGGFFEPLGVEAIALDKDLYVDVGRAWFDIGMTVPDWPRLVLGYEYQFKDGAKSSLAWSDLRPAQISPGVYPVAIFPSYKDLDESAHILKLDLSHQIRGVTLEDNFRAEFYDLDSRRMEYPPVRLGTAPSSAARFHEEYSHVQAVNSFRLEKQVKSWLLLGGGYLYSKLDGDGGFTRQALQLPSLMPAGPPLDAGSPILIERESHIYNLASLWGPWQGLTLSAGLQNEWTHEEGFGQGLLRILDPADPALQHRYESQRDKAILQETLGMRYTRIPFTVFFADARFRQEWIDHFERDEDSLENLDFLRDTDAELDLKDVRTGFTLSPWKRVSLDASYRHSAQVTRYDHRLDASPGAPLPFPPLNPPNGYPAFFRRRDIESDVIEARLLVHPASWVKTSFKYQRVATDYTTVTDPNEVVGLGTLLPGGRILAGNYDANVYSLNATLAPWRRVTLSSTVSYSDSRTVSGVDGAAGVQPYEGDTYSVLSSAHLVLNKAADWNLSYAFSRADYRQDLVKDSLPLGIRFDRHGLITGLTRRFGRKILAHLQYGFFYYDEPTAGGSRDYTAHAVFASWKMVFD